jgi:CTP:molybdopterin cytidylyltransferase MocA
VVRKEKNKGIYKRKKEKEMRNLLEKIKRKIEKVESDKSKMNVDVERLKEKK